MNCITINNVEYYHTTDLMNTDKEYFKCCKGKPRSILEWKKIADTDCIFAYQKDGKWIVSKKEYNKAYLLLTKSFCEKNLPSMKKTEPVHVEPVEEVVEKKNKKVDNKPLFAPPVLLLSDSEKFKDKEGKPIEIEVRGERAHDKIYFRAKHIAIAFDKPLLLKTLKESNSNYVYGSDYINFLVGGSSASPDKKTVKFLTYEGILRVIFNSRNGNASKFVKWATEVLFTHQMGTQEQRKTLASNLLGLPYGDMKKYLNIHTGLTYCIYLSILGKVSDLRQSMNIKAEVDDHKYVCKFGRTDNLDQRVKNHKSEYKEIKGVNWTLKKITMIEPYNGSKAETSLKQFVEPYKLDYLKKEELVVLSLDEMSKVEEKMQTLRYMYGTQSQELAGVVDDLNRQIEKEQMEKKFLQQELDFTKRHYEVELKIRDKEIENRDLKLEVYRLKYESK